jgi:hypothetical protein
MSGDTPTKEREPIYIRLPEPRRSWLIHCSDAFRNLGVCVIAVENGSIVIYAPDDSESFELDATGIAEFRAAFDQAVDVAETDLRTRATTSVRP